MNTTLPQPLSESEQFAQTEELLAFDGEVSTITQKALLQSIAHTSGDSIKVDLDKIRVKAGFNPRIKNEAYYAHIRSIADSIKTEGFYAHKPLAGMGGYENKRPVIFITDGGCRYEAIKLAISEGAQIDWVPVVLRDMATTQEDLTVALVRSNAGKQFSPLELSIVAKRLFKYGWSPQTIADKIGYTVTYINQLLTIAGAPSLIRQMIQDGEVPVGVAIQTMSAHGDEAGNILKDAVDSAKATGAKGITRKHLPDQILKRAIAKAAPTMITAIERVKADAAFKTLSDEVQAMIEGIITGIGAVTITAPPEAVE